MEFEAPTAGADRQHWGTSGPRGEYGTVHWHRTLQAAHRGEVEPPCIQARRGLRARESHWHDSADSPALLHLPDLEVALEHLSTGKERYARIIESRYFAGFSIPEIAQALEVSPTVIDRDWAKARAYLALRLQESPPPAAAGEKS